jgi:hypothetical protein
MKRRVIFLLALLPALLLTQCASSPQARPPSIEDVFRTASHEERILKLYHAVKALDDVPYVWGGSSPQWGMDCSGFTQYVMGEVGVHIPRTVKEQAKVGEKVSARHLMPGDLVFFDANRGRDGLDHVGIYMGNEWFAHSSSPVGVVQQRLDDYDHNVKLARRVMHERTGAYMGRVVVRARPDASDDECEPCEKDELLEALERRERKVKQRDTGSGELIGVRLEGSQVLYTIKNSDGSEYEFYVEKDSHSYSVEAHGNLLGMTIEWNEEYYNVKEW